jgi:UDP-N-acetylmuramate--alanine ligase
MADLEAARTRYPGRRIVALFQPHTYSRTTIAGPVPTCFERADLVFLADTYAAREEPSAGMDAPALAAEIRNPPAVYAGTVDEAAITAAKALRPGDVFLTVGAGDINEAGPRVLELLRAQE